MTAKANTTYAPRHAAKPCAPRHAMRARPIKERLKRILDRVNRWLDKDFTGSAMLLWSGLAGMLLGPLLFFCYFG